MSQCRCRLEAPVRELPGCLTRLAGMEDISYEPYRHYIVHHGERIYTDGYQAHIAYFCAGCDGEIPEDGLCRLDGRISFTGESAADFGVFLHRKPSCLTDYVLGKLREVTHPAPDRSASSSPM